VKLFHTDANFLALPSTAATRTRRLVAHFDLFTATIPLLVSTLFFPRCSRKRCPPPGSPPWPCVGGSLSLPTPSPSSSYNTDRGQGANKKQRWGKQGGEASSGEGERSEASAGFHGVGVVLAIDGDSSVGGCGHEEPHGAGRHSDGEEEKEMVVSSICASRSRTRSRCSRPTSNTPTPCECLCSTVFIAAASISRLQQLLPTAV
jgi:hypothetical protein